MREIPKSRFFSWFHPNNLILLEFGVCNCKSQLFRQFNGFKMDLQHIQFEIWDHGQVNVSNSNFRSKLIIITRPIQIQNFDFRGHFWSWLLYWGTRTMFRAYFKPFRIIIDSTLFWSENTQLGPKVEFEVKFWPKCEFSTMKVTYFHKYSQINSFNPNWAFVAVNLSYLGQIMV